MTLKRNYSAPLPLPASDARYRLSLFGGLRLDDGRESVTRFRTAPTAALLAYLALHPGVAQAREKLVALLWPDGALSTGRNNLSVSLHYLRGLLNSVEQDGVEPVETIHAERNAITLIPGRIATDVSQFEALISKARRSNNRQERNDLAEAALGLYQGTFLEGLYAEWILEEQRRFDALFDELSAMRSSVALRQDPTMNRVPSLKMTKDPDVSNIASGDSAVIVVASPPVREPTGNYASLQNRLSRFFARETEIAELCEWLRRYRLVTLTGPGGVGKTRLSEEAARQAGNETGRRILFVPLAAWSDANRLTEAIVRSLRIIHSGGDIYEALIYALAATSTLLVLDNLEHLLPDAGTFVECLLTRIPSLLCLTTSRRPLKAEGERIFLVAPLPVPSKGEEEYGDTASLSQNPAVALFVDRARAARPDFHLTERNRESVAALCRELEGTPLSIELAAARSLTLTPERMRVQLAQDSSRLLSRNRGGAARHRSLNAAIGWSYNLLTPEAQGFFAALSVFTGGWTAEAAEAIIGNSLATDLLAELTDDSLVRTHFANDGQTVRFSMLETLRAFAASHLPKTERDFLALRHADHFLREAEAAHEEQFYGDHRKAAAFFRSEEANLRAALETLRVSGDTGREKHLRMATALYYLWGYLNPAEGERLLSPAWNPMPDVADSVRARALSSLSGCLVAQGVEGDSARNEAVRIFHAIGNIKWAVRSKLYNPNTFAEDFAAAERMDDLVSAANLLSGRGVMLWPTGQVEEADRCFVEAAKRYREAGADFWLPGSLCEQAYSLHWRGKARQARPLLQEALRIFGALDHEDSHPAFILSCVELALGDYAAAEAFAERSAAVRRAIGPTTIIFAPLRTLCTARIYQGKLAEARETLTELEAAIRVTDSSFPTVYTGPPRVEIAWAKGDDAEALAIAQETLEATDAEYKHPDLSTCAFWEGIVVANARVTLAHAELRMGLPDIVRETLQETLRFRDRCNIRGRALSDIEGIAAALLAEDESEHAARLFAAAHVLRLHAGTPLPPSHAAFFSPLAAAAKLAHPAAWRTGSRLTLDDALGEALTD